MRVLVWIALLAGTAHAEAITVFFDRGGQLSADGARIVIPPYGGDELAWRGTLRCVRDHFAPFDIAIVETPPTGSFIHVIVGGRASDIGLDDATTNGNGEHVPATVLRSAEAHVFSRVGTGERDIANLCAVAAHEIGHNLGLDHSYFCGDVMSYYHDECGVPRFVDVDAPCGEHESRTCDSGNATQNSYRWLLAKVGARTQVPIDPYVDPRAPIDPYGEGYHGNFRYDATLERLKQSHLFEAGTFAR
jgi:hypothetical protein